MPQRIPHNFSEVKSKPSQPETSDLETGLENISPELSQKKVGELGEWVPIRAATDSIPEEYRGPEYTYSFEKVIETGYSPPSEWSPQSEVVFAISSHPVAARQ